MGVQLSHPHKTTCLINVLLHFYFSLFFLPYLTLTFFAAITFVALDYSVVILCVFGYWDKIVVRKIKLMMLLFDQRVVFLDLTTFVFLFEISRCSINTSEIIRRVECEGEIPKREHNGGRWARTPCTTGITQLFAELTANWIEARLHVPKRSGQWLCSSGQWLFLGPTSPQHALCLINSNKFSIRALDNGDNGTSFNYYDNGCY